MFNYCGFNAERSKEFFSSVCKRLCISAFADEASSGDDSSNDSPNEDSGAPSINFENLIANARKEEKDKLYPRIKKLEEDLKVMTQNNNDNLIKLAKAQGDLAEAQKAGDNSQVAELKRQLAEAQATIEDLKKSTPKEEDIRAKIEAEYEVKLYRQQKVNEGSDKILAVFADEVTGATKEEIDASFDKAVQKTMDIKKQLGLVDKDGKPAKASEKKTSEKSGNTTPPATNPEGADDEGFDPDYVRNLDPRSPEYAEFRKKMGLR